MTIKQRQHLLAYLGFYAGAADGDWGSGSREACEAFQRSYNDSTDKNITVDGYGGPETDKALRYAVANDLFKAEAVDKIPNISVIVDKATEENGGFPDWWDEIEYFDPPEIACKCGDYHEPYCNGYPHEMQKLTMQIADRARKHFGQPITVISGLRCPQHNTDSKGVANSQHMYGEALDVYVHGVSQQTALTWFLSQPDVRYAYAIADSSNVHFDIQPVGR